MEKLRKYNQRLLAVLGTMAALALGGLLFLGLIEIVSSLYDRWNTRWQDNDLVVNKPDEAEVPLRSQAISFGTPQLIDTLQERYLIPVSQVNLEQPEPLKRSSGESGFLSQSESGKASYKFAGVSYNNFLLYDRQAGTQVPVFQRRTSIHRYEVVSRDTVQYLLMEGTQRDTNKDGKLNAQDLQALFVFRVGQTTTHRFAPESFGLEDYTLLHESHTLLARFREDKNQSGTIEQHREPAILKQILLSEAKIQDFVHVPLPAQLQKWVDGVK